MVSKKVNDLKNELCVSFSQIFELCMMILNQATRPSLIVATLETLLRFINWIPSGFIFETSLIPMLIEKVTVFFFFFNQTRSPAPCRVLTMMLQFLPIQQFRSGTIKCLTEIATISETVGPYEDKFRELFNGTLLKVLSFLPLNLGTLFAPLCISKPAPA